MHSTLHFSSSRRLAITLLALIMLCLASPGCARKSVKPISIKNPVLSEDSRRLLADNEDAVSIRRAARDDARRALKKSKARSENLLERSWPANASAPLAKLKALEAARLELAELQLDHAQAQLDLAFAKYDHTTAQTAMRHDLAVYELEPLKKAQEKAKEDSDELFRKVDAKRREIDKLEAAWWSAYASFVKGGGESTVFFLSEGATAKSR